MGRPFAKREEVATQGFDPYRQLVPDAFGTPGQTGILLPAPPLVYLALLAVADLAIGDSLVGVRQYIDLVAVQGSGDGGTAAPFYPLRQPIIDPMWTLPDGGDTWILTREPKRQIPRLQGPWDQESFIFRDTDGPALVYETAGFPPAAAATIAGYPGLNAYTAPAVQGVKVQAVRDRRWPWGKQSNQRIDFTCRAPERWRLYAQVQQSNPATRAVPTLPTPIDGYAYPPEEGFLQNFPTAIYGWVSGALIIERGGEDRDDCV